MSDDRKFVDQTEGIDNIKKIAELEEKLEKTEEESVKLKKQIKELKSRNVHRFRLFVRRLDTVPGLHWVKLLFWIGMADGIIFLSSDANTKAISSFTYILGIIFDMLLLRKQQTKTSTDNIRATEGFLILMYIVFAIILAIGIASAALGYTFIEHLSLLMNWGLPVCGILSTSMELINGIIEND